MSDTTSPAPEFAKCFSVRALAKRWRVRTDKVQALIRSGRLHVIQIPGSRPRITPESVREAERGVLAVKPAKRRKREAVPAEVAEMLGD